MATLTYATSSDCWGASSWTGTTAPSNAATLLRSASLLVRRATFTAVYPTDANGLPSEAATLTAFKEATCAHAAALQAAGVDPLAAGTTSTIGATSIGSASVTYAGSAEAAAARQRLVQELCPEALMILADAGLLGNPPMIRQG